LAKQLAKLKKEAGNDSPTLKFIAAARQQVESAFSEAPLKVIESFLKETTTADLSNIEKVESELKKLVKAEEAAQTLRGVGLLPRETLVNLKQARTRLDSLLKNLEQKAVTARNETDLRAILADSKASEDKKKEARVLLRALLKKTLKDDSEELARELSELVSTFNPFSAYTEFKQIAEQIKDNNQQKLAYLKKALAAVEKVSTGHEGATKGAELRTSIKVLESRIKEDQLALEKRLKEFSPTTDDFAKVAQALEHDIRKQYQAGSSERASKLKEVQAVRKQFQDKLREAAQEDLNEFIKAIKDVDEDIYKQLLRERIKATIKQFRGDRSNTGLLAQIQSDRQELNRFKTQASPDKLEQASKSPLFAEGESAAKHSQHKPLDVPEGSRQAALFYYETQKRLNLQALHSTTPSPSERQQLTRDVELYTANIRILRQEIAGTIGWVHKLNTAVESFFRYAAVYGAGYSLFYGVQDFTKEILELDKALKSIQAVAQASEDQMVGVEEAIKNIATTTQFSTQQMAEATQVLAQAGVEAKDLPRVLDAVAKFASATASDLTLAADVLSSLREVFTGLSDVIKDSRLADSLTNAVNISKLNVQDLQVITSLGAQTAKAFNISSDQFLAAAATLSNVGIRKSTVGTGLRQAMLEILNPDSATLDFLKQRYAKIGEMLSDEAIKGRFQSFQSTSDPLSSALNELKRIGVAGSARYDFRRVVDIRAENVLLPLMDSLEIYQQNIAKIAQTGSAAKGAEVQMTAFLNTWNRLQSEIDSAGHSILTSFLPALRDMTGGLADMVRQMRSGLSGASDQSDTTVTTSAGKAVVGGLMAGALMPGSPVVKGIVGLLAGLGTFATDLYGRTGGGIGSKLTVLVEWVAGMAGLAALLKRQGTRDILTQGKAGLEGIITWFTGIFAAIKGATWAELPGKLLGAMSRFNVGVAAAIGALMGLAELYTYISQQDPGRKAEMARTKAAENKAEADKIESNRATYDQNEPGSRGRIVKDARDQLSQANAGLLAIGINTADPQKLESVSQFASMEKGSYRYEQARQSLGLEKETADKAQELASAFVSAHTQLKKLIVDEYGTLLDALSDKIPDKDIQQAIINSKNTLTNLKVLNNSGTFEEILGQANTLLDYIDTITGDLKDRAEQAKSKQGNNEVSGLEGAVDKEKLQTEINRLTVSGDTEGLKDLQRSIELEKVKKEADIEKLKKQLSNRISILPFYDDFRYEGIRYDLKKAGQVFDTLSDLLNQAKDSLKAASNAGDAAESAQSAMQSDIELSKTTRSLISDFEKEAGIGAMEKDLTDFMLRAESSKKALERQLAEQKTHSDQAALSAETENQIRELDLEVKQKQADLEKAKAGLAYGKQQISEGPVPAPLLNALQKAFTFAESRGNPDAVSAKGAIGLMQIMPATGLEVARKLKIAGVTEDNIREKLKDPELNKQVGTEYLRQMLVEQKGDYRKAAAAYNFGPGNFQEILNGQYKGDFEQFVEKANGGAFKAYLANIEKSLPDESRKYLASGNTQETLAELSRAGKDSPGYKQATEVVKSQDEVATAKSQDQLADEKAARDQRLSSLDKEIQILQAQTQSLRADLQLAQRDNETQKAKQLVEAVRISEDDLTRKQTERETTSRNVVDPAYNQDILIRQSAQLKTNQAQAESERLQIEQRERDRIIRLDTFRKESLEAAIKLFNGQGDLAQALSQIDELDKLNRKLAQAYLDRDVAAKTLFGDELKLREQQNKNKNDLEAYTKTVEAYTAALTVQLRKIEVANDLSAEVKAVHAYQAGLGNALPESEKRAVLSSDYRRADESRRAVMRTKESLAAEMAAAKEANPQLDLSDATKELANLDKQAEGFARSMAEAHASLYRLDVEPLQALADISLTNLVEGLNSLSYSAQNLQHTLEGQLVSGIDNVITGLADFVTHGEQAKQAADNMRQAVVALRDAQLQYNTALVDRPRVAFEARQEANAQVLDKRRQLLAKGASPEELAALEQNSASIRQSAFQSAMQPQDAREMAARQTVQQAEKDKTRADRENSLFGRTTKAIADTGRGILQTVVQSTLLNATKNFLGLGERGSDPNNALWVKIVSGATPGEKVQGDLPTAGLSKVGAAIKDSWIGRTVGGWFSSDKKETAPPGTTVFPSGSPSDVAEKKLIENTSDTLDRPLQGFSNGIKGAFDTVTDGIGYVGSTLFGIGKQFLAMMTPQADTGATVFRILGAVASIAGSVAGAASGFGAGGGFGSGPSLKEVSSGTGSLSTGSMQSSGFSSSLVPASLKAEGGYIEGPGTSTSDSIPARLSHGEYVVKASAVQAFGRQNLDRINQFRFANGGFVNKASPPSVYAFSKTPASGYNSASNPGTQIQIVDQRKMGSPDIETQQSRDALGREQIRFMVRDEIKSSINSGVMDSTFKNNYGSRRPGFQR